MGWGDKGGDNSPWGKPSSGGSGGGGHNQGGNSPQGPDLEDFLRKSQDRFKELFPRDKNEGGKGVVLLIAVVVLLWVASGIYFVKADEQGVVLTFGKYSRTTSPGLNYHFPYPIEKALTPRVTAVNRIEVGFRSGSGYRGKNGESAVGEESHMLTGDENIIDIDFEVQWKIADASQFLFNVRDPEETVKAVSESAMREVIGKGKIASVLAEGKLQVEQDTRALIQETLNNYKAGIDVMTVNLLKADPPAQVIDAFRDVQTALADMETARNQAEAYRNDIIPRARGEAQKMILDSQAYKQEVVARAQGEASRFSAVYKEFAQAKDVTKKRMYLETMEEILQGMNKIVIDGKGSQGVLPYLPLPELKKSQPAEEVKP